VLGSLLIQSCCWLIEWANTQFFNWQSWWLSPLFYWINCCIVDGYYCCLVDRHCFFFLFCKIAVCTVCKSQAYFIALSPRLSATDTMYLFTLSFLSKQTSHGSNMVSSYFFLFICGPTKCLSCEQRVGSGATVDALCFSCSLQKYLEWWPAAFYEAGRSVLMLMKGSTILRIERNTVHLYQPYSLLMPNKLQYTWHGDYCQCVRPAQLPVLTEVLAPSLLEQHPRYVPPPGPHRIQQNDINKQNSPPMTFRP
jgi:hypothetical protein